jgi:hypothetical protein
MGTLRSLVGVVHPLVRRAQDFASIVLDWLLGVSTTPRANDPDAPPPGLGLRPFAWLRTVRLFMRYPLRADDVLVDIGSGSGRVALLTGLWFRCRRVIGLERDPTIDRLARRNLDSMRLRLRSPVEFVCDDATVWAIPDDTSVLFFNNVFTGETFEMLVANILATIERSPRTITFLYGNPRAADVLLEHPQFVLVDEMRSWRPDPEWAQSCAINVYKVGTQWRERTRPAGSATGST